MSRERIFERKISDDVRVDVGFGYGRATVTITMTPGDMSWTCDMDAELARALGVALMDAASAADVRERTKQTATG